MTTLAPARVAPRRTSLRPVPTAAAVLAVLVQIAYPLVHGSARGSLTIVGVLLFFLATASHALLYRGPRWAGVLLATSIAVGLGVEAVGVHTGLPFGRYRYRHTLGPEWASVPLVIPLAWAMMAYPALLVGRRIGRRPLSQILAAGAALASWDLFLDPQMVAAGYWHWSPRDQPTLLGIPLSNDVGWLLTAVALMAVLAVLLPADPAPGGGDAVPLALYLWTYGGSVLANVAFFGRPWVGLLGGLGMGAVVYAYLRAG